MRCHPPIHTFRRACHFQNGAPCAVFIFLMILEEISFAAPGEAYNLVPPAGLVLLELSVYTGAASV
jgi:hypothetical protein